MICICGHAVTEHARLYDGVLYKEGWFTADGEGRFLGRSARPFTLSGECRAIEDRGTYRLSCPCRRFARAVVAGPAAWIASCGSTYCTSKLMVLDGAGREEAALRAAGWAPVDRGLRRGPWLCSACQKLRERQDAVEAAPGPPRRMAIGPMPASAVKDLRPYRCHWSLGLDDPCEFTFSTTSQCKNHDGPRHRTIPMPVEAAQDIRDPRFGALRPGTVADCPAVAIPHPGVGNPAEPEWWKKYDRPQSAGRPEVM